MNYSISAKARTDLIGIWEYTFENWSHTQADKYYGILFNKIDSICKNPNLGRSYHHFRKNYLGYSVKSHIIFYRRIDVQQIEIMPILHKKIDLENRLNE